MTKNKIPKFPSLPVIAVASSSPSSKCLWLVSLQSDRWLPAWSPFQPAPRSIIDHLRRTRQTAATSEHFLLPAASNRQLRPLRNTAFSFQGLPRWPCSLTCCHWLLAVSSSCQPLIGNYALEGILLTAKLNCTQCMLTSDMHQAPLSMPICNNSSLTTRDSLSFSFPF